MRVYAVATSEVQEDSTLTDAEVFTSRAKAERHAHDFMFRCVGDFLVIDPADVDARRRALEKRLFLDKRPSETRYLYECEGLVLSATVQESSIRVPNKAGRSVL